MSGFYGYPSIPTGYSGPAQQLPASAMGSTVPSGYPMMAPAMPQIQQPVMAPPAAAAASYIPAAAYPATGGVYGSAVPVQPVAYPMVQAAQQPPQQQQQVAAVFPHQQTPVFSAMASMPMHQPPLPLQQQATWQTVQPAASLAPAVTNYQAVSQFRPVHQNQQVRPVQSQQIRPSQNQQVRPAQTQQVRPAQNQQIRPAQNQQVRPAQTQQVRPAQSQQIRPAQNQQVRPAQNQQVRPAQTQPVQPAQNQQIRPTQTQQVRPSQNQQVRPTQVQQQQRPQLRPRVPAVGGTQRGALAPSSQLRQPTPRAGAPTVGPMSRMRPALPPRPHPPPLFGKPNLRPIATTSVSAGQKSAAANSKAGNDEELPHCPPIPGAVGTEYVMQIRTEQRGAAALQYHCRLCDCRFIDVQARDLHVKGRRHRLQYKRKVDPRISVDAKPGVKARPSGLGTQDSVAAAAAAVPSETATEAAKRRRKEEEQRMRDMQELECSNFVGCKQSQPRRPESNDDRQVLAKHSSIYPTEAELHAVQNLVTRCERALKLASDHLSAESDGPPPLRGVMRVGALAKGLLLHGDLATQLVLLCASWPTKELRDRIIQLLPERLEEGSEPGEVNTATEAPADKPESSAEEQQQPPPEQPQPQKSQELQVRLDDEEGCIIVQQSCTELDSIELTCSIHLTSPAVREEAGSDTAEPEGALDRDKCLEALAALRQAKWFQAKASSLQSCVPVIRVMRDMCQRLPVWGPLPNWAMELLVERCISCANGGQPLSPGEAIRRVMECLASGILLPLGPGLRDPCEKAPVDAAGSMTAQEREDITASAQQALRLIAFRQLHRVLDMPPLVPPPPASSPASAAPAAKRPATAAGPNTPAKQARVE